LTCPQPILGNGLIQQAASFVFLTAATGARIVPADLFVTLGIHIDATLPLRKEKGKGAAEMPNHWTGMGRISRWNPAVWCKIDAHLKSGGAGSRGAGFC
jgi:hypothetical protein